MLTAIPVHRVEITRHINSVIARITTRGHLVLRGKRVHNAHQRGVSGKTLHKRGFKPAAKSVNKRTTRLRGLKERSNAFPNTFKSGASNIGCPTCGQICCCWGAL